MVVDSLIALLLLGLLSTERPVLRKASSTKKKFKDERMPVAKLLLVIDITLLPWVQPSLARVVSFHSVILWDSLSCCLHLSLRLLDFVI